MYFNSMWTWHHDAGIAGQYSKNIYLGTTRLVTKQTSHLEASYGQSEELHNQYYYHPDHLGSAQLITDYNGEEYQRLEYTPYGEIWIEKASNLNDRYLPYKFTGKERDEETGLYYFGARYMDPQYSRWLSTDPALGDYVPGLDKEKNSQLPAGGLYNLLNLNLYHYAANNPITYTDPDGRTTRITITNQKVKDLSNEFRKQYGLIGTGEMRIVGSSGGKTVVDTYLMSVTDDKTNTTTYYEVTRNAPYLGDKDRLAFNPKESTEKFYGRLLDLGDGLGEKIELWNSMSGTDRNTRADITGDGSPDYIQIHVGGVYQKDDRNYIMGSLGCYGLNGKDAGNKGRDRFMSDVSERYQNSGGRIEIYVQRIDE